MAASPEADFLEKMKADILGLLGRGDNGQPHDNKPAAAPVRPQPSTRKKIPTPPALEGPIANYDGTNTSYVYPSGAKATWDGTGWSLTEERDSVWDEASQRWVTTERYR
jgi:hypothetical protein